MSGAIVLGVYITIVGLCVGDAFDLAADLIREMAEEPYMYLPVAIFVIASIASAPFIYPVFWEQRKRDRQQWNP